MADCACQIKGNAGGEIPDTYDAEMRTAEKEMKCSECARAIETGDEYEYAESAWCGFFNLYIYATCSDCLSIRAVFFCNWTHGGLLEDLAGYLYDVSGRVSDACMALLTPKARLTVIKMIDELWEDESLWDEDEDDE